jgi:hypothetical protein
MSPALGLIPDVLAWWGGGQTGYLHTTARWFVSTPLTLVSTWDGDELSLIRQHHQLRAARRLVLATASAALDEAAAIANDETSGLAAAIVTADANAAGRFLAAYRGTAAFWNATTRFTDGFALTGSPETGINVDRVPGPRGPVTYRDLYLRQYRVVGDGTQSR